MLARSVFRSFLVFPHQPSLSVQYLISNHGSFECTREQTHVLRTVCYVGHVGKEREGVRRERKGRDGEGREKENRGEGRSHSMKMGYYNRRMRTKNCTYRIDLQ